MAVSSVDGGAPAADEPMGRKRKGRAKTQGKTGAQARPQETPFWEKVAGIVGLLIVVGIVGFLVYEAAQPQTEAEIVAQVKSIKPQAGGYLVEFAVSNHGRQTAAAVVVEGALDDRAQPEQPLETAEMTFDYVPDQSDRTGAFVFSHDPRQYELRLQVKGFMNP